MSLPETGESSSSCGNSDGFAYMGCVHSDEATQCYCIGEYCNDPTNTYHGMVMPFPGGGGYI